MAKEFRCAVLKPGGKQRTQPRCNESASSTPRGLSTRFTKKPNTFLGWEVEPEPASGRVWVGTSLGEQGTLNSHVSTLPSLQWAFASRDSRWLPK